MPYLLAKGEIISEHLFHSRMMGIHRAMVILSKRADHRTYIKVWKVHSANLGGFGIMSKKILQNQRF